MTEQRQISRAKARQRRAEARASANHEAENSRRCVASVVLRAQEVIASRAFLECAHKHAVTSVPVFLSPELVASIEGDVPQSQEFGDRALDFVIVWKFLYPLFSIPEIAEEFERNWPGFISEMKDAFILLVTHGPFPEQCCAMGRLAREPFPVERKNRQVKLGAKKPGAPVV